MAEYLEREDLIKRLEARIKDYGGDCKSNAPIIANTYKAMLYDVKNMKKADVVEVVRCKDCKHHEKDEAGYWCNKSFSSFRTVEDNFCKFGAKMDKEENL